MKKNDCVSVDTKLATMIEEYCQSETVDNSAASFARKVGQYNRWVSDLKRGRNKIKKEVAVRVCLLLQTTPEEILLHSGPTEEETQKCLEDIEEVKRLIEEERGRNAKKEAPAEVGGGKDALLDFIRKTDDRTTLLAVLDEVNKKLQEMR